MKYVYIAFRMDRSTGETVLKAYADTWGQALSPWYPRNTQNVQGPELWKVGERFWDHLDLVHVYFMREVAVDLYAEILKI